MNIPAVWKTSSRGGSVCYAHYLNCFIEIRRIRVVHRNRRYDESDYGCEYTVIPQGLNIPQLRGINKSLNGVKNDAVEATTKYRANLS